ncbi:MFS general substrate transporter [Sporormia fimetaria CBS 119925]|uniref:MFS general substrate transporter n=1 Tax=Sporormia fimetaria CBS 119925 TaxID=1340428 RepID=A0A6A6VCK6_9PLEO|nr:MFS general substrate transporter [Sporormia fimetaria CBS 119925]
MPAHDASTTSCSTSSKDPGRANSQASDEKVSKSEEAEVACTQEDAISIASSEATTVSQTEEEAPTKVKSRGGLSRTTSVTPDAIIVERRNRRGLFSQVTLIPEVECAYHYVNKTKWLITSVIAFCGMAGPMGSAIVMPVLGEIARDLHASPVLANMSVGVYMLAMGVFPLWWSAFSEDGAGRRSIYIISFALFLVFGVLSAVSTNISMLVVCRTLSGGAAASVQVLGAGTIADIWEVKERGRALGLFYLGPLCGPLLAPIIGGVLGQGLGWRSTQWFLVIYGGLTLILIVFCLPETLPTREPPGPTLPTHEKSPTSTPLTPTRTHTSVVNKTTSLLRYLHKLFISPLSILAWLRFPPVALTVYYASITFGSLYFLNISLQHTFSRAPYNFSTLLLGLLYIPGSLGYVLASLIGGRWLDTIMAREALRASRFDSAGKLIYHPEDRMRENAWLAGITWPIALIWYGWSAGSGVHWSCPLIANFWFGVGSMLIFSMVTTMLTELLPRRASAGVAINNFVRSAFCFAAAVSAEPLIGWVGEGWLMTVLGVWSLGTGAGVIWGMGEGDREGVYLHSGVFCILRVVRCTCIILR